MGRQACCEKIGLKRGPWTIEEDHKLMTFILNNGIQCWRMVPKLAGLLRCGKSCRLRWINYLRPDLKRGAFSEMEENQIIELHARLGNRWSKIASHLPGRTDNEIKNHWNTRIKKKLKLLGINPLTHQPLHNTTTTTTTTTTPPPPPHMITQLELYDDQAGTTNHILDATNHQTSSYAPSYEYAGDSLHQWVDNTLLWDTTIHIPEQHFFFTPASTHINNHQPYYSL